MSIANLFPYEETPSDEELKHKIEYHERVTADGRFIFDKTGIGDSKKYHKNETDFRNLITDLKKTDLLERDPPLKKRIKAILDRYGLKKIIL